MVPNCLGIFPCVANSLNLANDRLFIFRCHLHISFCLLSSGCFCANLLNSSAESSKLNGVTDSDS